MAESYTEQPVKGFIPYEKMRPISLNRSSNPRHTEKLDSIKKWVATEKIHGANFSFTVVCTQNSDHQLDTADKVNPPTVLVARRGDYLKEGELSLWSGKTERVH